MHKYKSAKIAKTKLVRLNHLLAWTAVGLGLYLVALPAVPYINFYLYSWKYMEPDHRSNISVSPRVAQAVSETNGVILVPEHNTLQIDKIGVDGQVFEGDSVSILNKGIWHRPNTSTPDKGGNTVLVAHRFLYRSGPNTFFMLDKVEKGDKITLWWGNVRYTYEVTETKLVEPTETEIEAETSEPILTLYTCAPLFSSAKRLVVIAKPLNLP